MMKSFNFQNLEYLTTQETKPEPMAEIDHNTIQKLQWMLKDPDTEANILWITVSRAMA